MSGRRHKEFEEDRKESLREDGGVGGYDIYEGCVKKTSNTFTDFEDEYMSDEYSEEELNFDH